ncbi:hypothetical protein AVEN_162172-1 [Araneus ventricosus]|uniref:Uncharacterized protein n=1 Tax=Araneus ventricosus TaxID=182803 RepID=A0A4Y2GWU3_ARAVE|nr:hypothetical protein AVEN_162172-1 [Araneus ventricosus]
MIETRSIPPSQRVDFDSARLFITVRRAERAENDRSGPRNFPIGRPKPSLEKFDRELQKESIIRWQNEWDNGETGRSVHNVLPKVRTTPTSWQRPEIMFVTSHGPFPTYLKRFNIRSSDSFCCGNLRNPLHYATSCLFTTSYHQTKPSVDLEPLWWERVMNNNNSRAKIRKLILFIEENETLFFPKDGDNNYSHRLN